MPTSTSTGCIRSIAVSWALSLNVGPSKNMKTSPDSSLLGFLSRAFLMSVCALSVAALQIPALNAAELITARPLADQTAPNLPVEATFSKVKSEDMPPYVLTLKNTSSRALEVNVTVLLSVMSHNRDKARRVPAQIIEPGKTWKVEGLAAADKVTVAAKGFAPLELVVK